MAEISSLKPIDSNAIKALYPVLEQVFAEGDHLSGSIKDLDVAMLMNVPPGRMPEFKKAVAGGSPYGDDDDKAKRTIKPSQAILARLLMRYPHYAPLIPLPSPNEVWRQVKPLVPSWLADSRYGEINSIIFAPLFGRSYPTSYKFLGGDHPNGATPFEPPTNVMRLFMLVLERLGGVFRQSLVEYLKKNATKGAVSFANKTMKRNWLVLHQEEQLIDELLPESDRQTFAGQVLERKKGWFELYIQVLCDEAASRNVDAREALTRGKWRNTEPVTPEVRSRYPRRKQPITGADMGVFERIRNGAADMASDNGDSINEALPTSEFFWLIGVSVKAFYSIGNKPEQRIDPVTSILVRYLSRYTGDVQYFLNAPTTGDKLLATIRTIDPDFRLAQLCPLFGGAYSSSYHFTNYQRCPHDLRRLVSIFMREVEYNPDIYWQIRQCVEEEAYARGISTSVFWRELRWYPREEVSA